MNQQLDFPPPPPTPSPNANNGGLFPSSLRRRAGPATPPSLTTTFLRSQASGLQAHSPASAVALVPSLASPYPDNHPQTAHPLSTVSSSDHRGVQLATPAIPRMAAQTYNPRQWTQRGHGSGSHITFQTQRTSPRLLDTRDVTGMEIAMPSPPPPYTPENVASPAGPMQSLVLDNVLTASPVVNDLTYLVNSPEEQPLSHQVPSFAPPPGVPSRYRERSSSGIAGRLANFASRTRQVSTTESQLSSPAIQSPLPVAPAARRAASTGNMPTLSSAPSPPDRERHGSPDESRWQPGMPLPPPPPGPPPSGSRSQSMSRAAVTLGTSTSGTPDSRQGTDSSVRRRAQAPKLGPVPPTPANWSEGDTNQGPTPDPNGKVHALHEQLRIETGASSRDQSLTRRPATREPSAQGIRERRSQSRAAREARDNDASSGESRPSDLVLSTGVGSISKRREHARKASGYAGGLSPKIQREQVQQQQQQQQSQGQSHSHTGLDVLTPPYTPAVGVLNTGPIYRRPGPPPNSAGAERPAPHLPQNAGDDPKLQVPSSPAIPPPRPPSNNSLRSSKLDGFALQALERHRKFIELEVAATSDEDRLELFANFIVHESRLRRDKYFAAYNAMAADITDLTRDMWRSHQRGGRRTVTPSTTSSLDPAVPSWASDGQPGSAQGNAPSSATSLDGFTPATDKSSSGDPTDSAENPESRQWDRPFKPSLSPIPSMAQSSARDEGSSRGRTQSRWWESDSGSIGKPGRIEKTRRETKYMGVNATMLQEVAQPSPATMRNTPTPGASVQSFQIAGYGPDEYPSEKTGFHDSGDFETPVATPGHQKHRKTSTPGFDPLDVSRLVTLPPPFPRHHPAVNNSHPLLSGLRNEHRALAESENIEDIKGRYHDAAATSRQLQEDGLQERKLRQRALIQENVMNGKMTYAEAARAEAELEAAEAERAKNSAQSNFETFESVLAHPLNALLAERIGRANDCIKQLCVDLEAHNNNASPDQTQEEGDERPERLEKLTLLKWLFEARQQLHKEMFDLHTRRSDMYSEVVLAPYRASKDHSKVEEITSFFAKDKQERQMSYARESLKRVERLHAIMDHNVSRGVEDQLSAFWDIAPPLLHVIQKLPSNLSDQFEIFIPPQEYDENPVYHDHPLQYLYTVLSHAEKSTYQFIESQTNLLCLQHEVRTAITKSSQRLIELERAASNPGDVELRQKMLRARQAEEDGLTRELQEKVGEVERQWREALGDGLEDCKGRVRMWLERSNGWDESLDE